MTRNIIPRSVHFKLFKFFGGLHVLVKDTILFVASDILDGFGIHSQNDAICDKCFPGGMVGDQFIFGLDMFLGLPT